MKKLAAVVSAAVCIGLVACGGSQKTSVPITNTTEGGAAQVAPTAVIETSEDGHRLLPPSAVAFFGVDFAKMSQAPILDPFEEKLLTQLPPEVGQLKSECGLDIMKDFDWLIGGLAADQETGVFIVKGNFSQSQVEGCIEKMSAGGQAKISAEGALRVYDVEGDRMLAAWPTDSVVILSKENARSMIEEVAARAQSKAIEASVAAELAHVDTTAALWLTARVMPEMSSGLPVQDLSAIRMTIEAAATLDLVFAAEFSSSAKASELYNQVIVGIQMAKNHPMAQPFASIIDKTKIAHTDRVVSGSVYLTDADMSLIETTMMGMGGMMGP